MARTPRRRPRATTAATNSGSVSHRTCERTPSARPAARAPTGKAYARSDTAPPDTPRVRSSRRHASSNRAWATSAAARPGTSLIGRLDVNHASGATADRMAAQAAAVGSGGFPGITCARVEGLELEEHRVAREQANRAAQRAPQRQSQRGIVPTDRRQRVGGPNRADEGRGQLAECNVDRVPGRMRMMLRRVERADAEREVHRVDVIERRREEGEMSREEHGGRDRRGAPARTGGEARPPAGSRRCGVARMGRCQRSRASCLGGAEAKHFVQAARPVPLRGRR